MGFVWAGPEESIEMVYKTWKVGYRPQKRDFEVEDFSFAVENPISIGSASSGGGEGKACFHEFTVSPGGHYKKTSLNIRHSGDSGASSAPCTWCPR